MTIEEITSISNLASINNWRSLSRSKFILNDFKEWIRGMSKYAIEFQWEMKIVSCLFH